MTMTMSSIGTCMNTAFRMNMRPLMKKAILTMSIVPVEPFPFSNLYSPRTI